MWRFLGELAITYCSAASWARAAGDEAASAELVQKAWMCLLQRGWYKPGEALEMRDVIKGE